MSGKQQEPAEGKEENQAGEEHKENTSRELLRLVLMGIAALLSWIGNMACVPADRFHCDTRDFSGWLSGLQRNFRST